MIVRPFNLVILIVLGISIFMMFQINHRVSDIKNELQLVHNELRYEKDSLHVLKAEWSYLSHPDRVRDLASKHLGMQSMTVAQIGSLDNEQMQLSQQVVFDQYQNFLAAPVIPTFKPAHYEIPFMQLAER